VIIDRTDSNNNNNNRRVCVARARRLLVDLIFFPDFLSGRTSPDHHLPLHRPYRSGFGVVRRAFREHLARTRHTHTLARFTHTLTRSHTHAHTQERNWRVHTHASARAHTQYFGNTRYGRTEVPHATPECRCDGMFEFRYAAFQCENFSLSHSAAFAGATTAENGTAGRPIGTHHTHLTISAQL